MREQWTEGVVDVKGKIVECDDREKVKEQSRE